MEMAMINHFAISLKTSHGNAQFTDKESCEKPRSAKSWNDMILLSMTTIALVDTI